MNRARRLLILFVFGVTGWGVVIGSADPTSLVPPHQPVKGISGLVVDEAGPCDEARIRRAGRVPGTLSNSEGQFFLPIKDNMERPITITAWKSRHFIAAASTTGDVPISLRLRPWPQTDNTDYRWVNPTPHKETFSCGTCHESLYNDWSQSAHGPKRPRFESVWRELEQQAPEKSAVCLSCHDPAPFHPNVEFGSWSASGVHCDFCHKVVDAVSEPIGLTHGRFGLDLLRPGEGQFIVGPWIDSPRPENSYAPIQRSSRFCAPCHEGIVFGVRAYETYSEWLASPAARLGLQCQDCHMKSTGTMTNVAPNHGGVERHPNTVSNHRFLAGDLLTMLKEAVTMSLDVHQRHAVVSIDVRRVGHRVPTGSPDRELILEIRFYDAMNRLLAAKYQTFAKRLSDAAGNSPVPFWHAVSELSDSRLSPDRPWHGAFRLPAETAWIEANLLYHRPKRDASTTSDMETERVHWIRRPVKNFRHR